jgi:hypothetical protein
MWYLYTVEFYSATKENEIFLLSQYYTHPKTRQGHSKKRELQANLFNELSCENPPYNTRKPNSTA